MPTLLTRERHLTGLREAVAAFERYADRAGPQRRDALAEVLRAHAAAPAAEQDHWTRRACHEAGLLALGAQGEALGRPPEPAELWLDPDLAADGIDELLGTCRLRPDVPGVLVIRPTDRREWWTLELGARRPRLTRHAGGAPLDGDWELTGPTLELFVRLAARAPMSSLPPSGLTPRRGPTLPTREAHP